jgi:hypothetical protein
VGLQVAQTTPYHLLSEDQEWITLLATNPNIEPLV